MGVLQAQYLAKTGYRKVLYIGRQDIDYGRLEQKGFCDTIKEMGVDFELTLQSVTPGQQGGDVAEEAINRQVRDFVAAALASKSGRPQAIVTFGDRYLISVCDVLNENGLVPGEDVLMVGADNMNLRGFSYATVDQNLSEIGQESVNMLLDRIDGNYTGEPRIHTVLPELVVHDSTDIT
jgi:DNA-binding LacI/PurR family transcriptional regulator